MYAALEKKKLLNRFRLNPQLYIKQAIIDALGHLDTMIRWLMSPQTEPRLGMYVFCFILIIY